MLTKEERTLLENVVEATNRLFDLDSTVTGVYSLLVATATAFHESEFAPAFVGPIRRLGELVRSGTPADEKRSSALNALDDLRTCISQELHRDAIDNPKRRHDVNPNIARDRRNVGRA